MGRPTSSDLGPDVRSPVPTGLDLRLETSHSLGAATSGLRRICRTRPGNHLADSTVPDTIENISRLIAHREEHRGVALVLQAGYGGGMTRTISQRELRNDSGAIMRALDRGEVFLVTRNGIPVGELRPARRRFVSRELLLEAFASASRVDANGFRDELDGFVDQTVEPRA